MEERTIKLLEDGELKILKRIVIISDRNNVETELGSILYTRPLTKDYNLKKQQEEDKSKPNIIDRLFQEYPKQTNYPEDEIDVIILAAIKNAFPKSILRNDTIFFNLDLEKLEVLKNRMVLKGSMYFSPEFSNISNIYQYVGKQFKAPRVSLNIYSYYKPEFLEGIIFYATYNAENEKVLDLLKSVQFE